MSRAQTLLDLLECARSWEPQACLVGNVKAGDIVAAVERAIEWRVLTTLRDADLRDVLSAIEAPLRYALEAARSRDDEFAETSALRALNMCETFALAQPTEAHTPKHLRPALPCVGMPHEWAKWISEDGEESFECQRCGDRAALCEACEDAPARPGAAICRECEARAICSVCGGTGRLSKPTYGIVEDIECAKCRGTGEDS